MIELDVRPSADGVPFVIHDDRTGRTARQNFRVAACDAARLAGVRLVNGEPLPSLADVFDFVRGAVPLVLDVKAPGGTAAALGVVSETGYRGPLLLSSALRRECEAARALAPALPCSLVTRRPSASDLAFCLRLDLASIHPDRRFLTVLRARRIVEVGLPFVPYVVDREDEFLRLVAAGAAGVFSNRAQELRMFWRARAGPSGGV